LLSSTGSAEVVNYINNSDTPGASTTLTLTVNDNANSGSGGAKIGSASRTINITAVNDAPVAGVPVASYSATEQTTLNLKNTGLAVSDVDSLGATETVTLSVADGQLNVSAGGSGVIVVDSGTNVVTLIGTINQINSLLNTDTTSEVSFVDNTDTPVAMTTLTLAVNDGGNSGSGGVKADSANVAINITAVNDVPLITSNGGAATATLSVTENQTAVTTVTSTDVDGGAPVYSILGGVDAALFSINAATGVLTFNTAPNFEIPTDAGANNIYDVIVQVADGNGGFDTQAIAVTVTNVNEAPVITSNGGAATAAINAAENQLFVTTITSTDVDGGAPVYTILGGADAALFNINAATGVLTFNTAPNFEIPTDAGANNIYDVIVQIADGNGDFDTQAIAVTVTNVNEAPVNTVPEAQAANEDSALALTGISVGDVEGNLAATQLSVNNGSLTVSLAGGAAISGGGNGSNTFTLTGNQAQINAALATISYQGNLNFNGVDTLTLVSSDSGGASDSDTIAISVIPVNDAALIAGAINGKVVEAGGVANATVNTPTAAGVLTATDIDNPANTFIAQAESASASRFGTYQITSGGAWTYTLDNANPQVEALNNGDTLTDSFTVQSADGTSQVVTITINGSNDNAVTAGVTGGTVTEAGGVSNGTANVPTATGVLIASDKDNPAAFQPSALTASLYGSYQVAASGAWTYILDNTNPAVQALNAGDTLVDRFTVLAVDGTPQIVTIAIKGSTDIRVGDSVTPGIVPVAVDNTPPPLQPAQTQQSAAEQPANDTAATRNRVRIEPLANTGDLFGALNLNDDAGRRGLILSPQSAIALLSGQGFISKLGLVARQENASLILAGYDFGEYTFQSGRFSVLHQASGRNGDIGEAGVTLQNHGDEDNNRGGTFTAAAAARVGGISLSLGIAAWALRSGGLVAAMLSSLPAWRQVDLLPILGDPDKRKAGWAGEDDESDNEAAREERAVDRVLGSRAGVNGN
jgi:VCBS repeat-containing protein